MATKTKTIINCMEPCSNEASSPSISIIIDPSQPSPAPANCTNVITIQHSCQEAQLASRPSTNKTLIDINRNSNSGDLPPASQRQDAPSLLSSSSSLSVFSAVPPVAAATNVISINCSGHTQESHSRPQTTNGKPAGSKMQANIFANGSALHTGSELRDENRIYDESQYDHTHYNNDDNNNNDDDRHHEQADDHRQLVGERSEKEEKRLTNVKLELTKSPEESGQTTQTTASSCTTTTIDTNSHTNTTNTTKTTTTTTIGTDTCTSIASQQVNNANCNYRENNGHFSLNQTNGMPGPDEDEPHDRHHDGLQLHYDIDHDDQHGHDDVKPGAAAGTGKRAEADGALDGIVGQDDGKRSLANGNSSSLLTKADTATAQLRLPAIAKLTKCDNSPLSNGNKENPSSASENLAHVVKIQINTKKTSDKQISVVKIENSEKSQSENVQDVKSEISHSSVAKELQLKSAKSELNLQIQDKMVQKPLSNHHQPSQHHPPHHLHQHQGAMHSVTITNASSSSNGTVTTTSSSSSSGATTVTELNVGNPNYMYYVMSSGQFSPCDTLDSGTGSDLETQQLSSQSPTQNHPLLAKKSSNGLEMHLKTTKIRVSNSSKDQRNCSFTDSEESETSSLSCDSLHSSEFIRQSSTSPIQTKTPSPSTKILGSYLPDSLLRDIKNLKFTQVEYEAENEHDDDDDDEEEEEQKKEDKQRLKSSKTTTVYESINAAPHHEKSTKDYVQKRNSLNTAAASNGGSAFGGVRNSTGNSSLARHSTHLPSKTFVLNQEDGTFIDTKMNSMPRRYEADKYYNFHVKEHENFRSFGNNSNADLMGDGSGGDGDDSLSISDYETRSLHDDVFAGYKDIRCGSATSTIRSSKGTVRGVKNRVRNGIATFLQLQQPNLKNYKEKDSGKVVLYTTSMGIIRDTYAKCSNVKQILRTLLIKFEERDVFMSVEYQQEIKERMHSEIIKVPQLFVEGQHIGDADTVERLNESGELRQLLKPYKSIATTFTCQTCGGYRLLPCPSCNGSKKSVHRNHFTAEFVALKCMNCDEVGLVKCHNC